MTLNPCFSGSFDFTPLDSSAVYVLSSMARQRRASQSSGGAVSPDCEKLGRDTKPPGHSRSPYNKANRSHASGTVSPATPTKCKRPMNAFMLFAKKYRVEYTQMYPGRDNRCVCLLCCYKIYLSISVHPSIFNCITGTTKTGTHRIASNAVNDNLKSRANIYLRTVYTA